MNINELKIGENILQISKTNSIILQNLQCIIEFYQYFDNCINEKEKDILLEFGNKTITNKDFVLYNFMDIQSVLDNLKYKKGSLLYEYLSTYIVNTTEETYNLEQFMEDYFVKMLNKSLINVKIEFENNINKIFQDAFEVKPIVENKNLTINHLLNYIIKNTVNKKFIIFVNSNVINLQLEECDNIILFDINMRKSLQSYNIIMYNNQIDNFNFQLVLNNLEMNWPIEYDNKVTYNWLSYYFKNCFESEKLYINQSELLIIASLMNKFYELNKQIQYDPSIINSIIKSFLADL